MVECRFLPANVQTTMDNEPFHTWTLPDGLVWTQFHRIETGYLLRFPNLADFIISTDGLRICCNPVPNVSKETVRHLYLNQILPLAHSIQGKYVFHASAVEIGDIAVAFMAESGGGKSTLATSFALNRFGFLTDDGLVIEPNDMGFLARPSHPSIRLWQDSEANLIPEGTSTAPPVDFTSKSRFLANEAIAFCDQPRPLQSIYFLGDGSAEKPSFQRMTAVEAHVELVKHSFILDIEEKALLKSHFHQVAKLIQQLSCYRLDYPRQYEALPEVRQAIVDHVQQTSSTVAT